jgi:hypothetical protein
MPPPPSSTELPPPSSPAHPPQGSTTRPEFLTSMSMEDDAVIVINSEGAIMLVSQVGLRGQGGESTPGQVSAGARNRYSNNRERTSYLQQKQRVIQTRASIEHTQTAVVAGTAANQQAWTTKMESEKSKKAAGSAGKRGGRRAHGPESLRLGGRKRNTGTRCQEACTAPVSRRGVSVGN